MNPAIRYWLVAAQAVFVLSLAAISSRPIPFEFSRPMGAALMIWSVGFLYLLGRTLFVAVRSAGPVEVFFENIKAVIIRICCKLFRQTGFIPGD